MEVKVRFYATYREITGSGEVMVALEENADVEELLRRIFEKYEKLKDTIIDKQTGNLSKYVKVFKNGRDIDFLEGLSTKLNGGDLIVMFPPVAGGSLGKATESLNMKQP